MGTLPRGSLRVTANDAILQFWRQDDGSILMATSQGEDYVAAQLSPDDVDAVVSALTAEPGGLLQHAHI